MAELDEAISAFQAGIEDVNQRLTDEFLVSLSHVQRLKTAWRQPVERILVLWSRIDVHGRDSLYSRLFQNPTVLKPVDPDFALSNGEPDVLSTNPANARISTHHPTILSGPCDHRPGPGRAD